MHLKKNDKPRFGAIILAAGRGSRMGTDTPKQYINYRGKPLIYYTLKTFQDSFTDEIVLVCPKDDIDYCRNELVLKYGFDKVKSITAGGCERCDSVYNGLLNIDCDFVMIHDGARVCVTQDILGRCRDDVIVNKATVAAVPVKDTIKAADTNGFVTDTPQRSALWQVQTPQCFDYELIKQAYTKMFSQKETQNVTDDAMVLENFGCEKVHLVMGSYTNIKVTTPDDLLLLDSFMPNVDGML